MLSRQSTTSRFTFIALIFGLLLILLPNIVLADEPSIQELVAGVDEKALHAALHESANGKYKHGVFQGDTHALEAVRKSNPVEARRIIQLARRQTNGTIPGFNTVIAVTTHIASIHTSTTIASTYTTTLPDGQPSTITSLILVQATDSADQVVPVSSSTPASTTSAKASLQTNTAGRIPADGLQRMAFAALAVGGMMMI